MADFQESTEIINLTKTLDDLRQIKSHDDKLAALKNQMNHIGESETNLKSKVPKLESTMIIDQELFLNMAHEMAENQQKHLNEKGEFQTILEEANEKLADLTRDLQALNVNQVQEKEQRITEIKLSLVEQRVMYEEQCKRGKLIKEEVERRKEELLKKFIGMKGKFAQLEEELEKVNCEGEQQTIKKAELEEKLTLCQSVLLQKSDAIKGLESTIQLTGDMFLKESEFDVVVNKLKETRSENKDIKLENMKYDEENDRLRLENAFLRKDINDFTQKSGQEERDLILLNKNLMEENRELQKHVSSQTAFQDMHGSAERDLKKLKAKVEIEREELNLKVNELEREKQRNEVKILSLENANIDKIKTISKLKLQKMH